MKLAVLAAASGYSAVASEPPSGIPPAPASPAGIPRAESPTGIPRAETSAVAMQQMRDQARAIQNRMDRIRATDDPVERRRLVDEQLGDLTRGITDLYRLAAQAPVRVDCPEGDTDCRLARIQAEQEALQRQMETIQERMDKVLAELEERDAERE
jgi:hypothetical protein